MSCDPPRGQHFIEVAFSEAVARSGCDAGKLRSHYNGQLAMTERLYYHDSFLYDFDGEIVEVMPPSGADGRHGIVLDRTAFYPTSGGQVHDTGWIMPESQPSSSESTEKLRVSGVIDDDRGRVVHYIEAERAPEKGTRVRGSIDGRRRLDHMRQHSGQHVLSAAFVRLFNFPTVSFHMGEESCSIDLDTPGLTSEQVIAAEGLANQIVLENRPVGIRFVTPDEARNLELRKIPPVEKDKLRLIDISEFDLTACGGTHVSGTGQIGAILLRKTEKVRQGWRVEFVCGERAVGSARHDYAVLTEAAGLFSSHIWDVPQQVRTLQDETRALRKFTQDLQEQIADLQAQQLLAVTPEKSGRKLVVQIFADRDLGFTKLLVQRLTRLEARVVALLATTADNPGLVFGQSAGQPFDMGALMKEAMSRLGGRGGGSKDLAQGGAPNADGIEQTVKDLASRLDSAA